STDIVKKDSSSLLGATLREISGDQLRKQGVSYGLEVTKVGNGKFQSAGIKKGFIILSINNKPVRTVSAARKLVEAAQKTRLGDKAILVKGFYPGDSMKYYAIDLS
ncbi:PDZ domain-containing protein, partial [Porphyromonas uenonis]